MIIEKGELKFKDSLKYKFNLTFSRKSISIRSINSDIWVSFRSKDKSFIKIGYNYLSEANLLYVYETTDNDTIKLLSEVDEIILDKSIKLKSSPEFQLKAFEQDPKPLVLCVHDSRDHDNYTLLIDLPKKIQQSFKKINSIDIKLTQEEIDSINYSLENNGCLLNRELNKKSKSLRNLKNTYILALVNKSDGIDFVIKIWPRYHYSPVYNHYDSTGLVKNLNGNFKIEWFNRLSSSSKPRIIKSGLLKQDSVTWYTNDYYKTYKMQNLNNASSITIQTSEHLKQADFYFDDLLNSVKSEFLTKKCELKYCSCDFKGHISGEMLNKIKKVH